LVDTSAGIGRVAVVEGTLSIRKFSGAARDAERSAVEAPDEFSLGRKAASKKLDSGIVYVMKGHDNGRAASVRADGWAVPIHNVNTKRW
jgi:hypothetical protein